MACEIKLLETQLRTGFVFAGSGRMLRTNDPDRSAAPQFVLVGCASGNVAGVRADVADDIAAEILLLAASEKPFVDPAGVPEHSSRYRALLSRGASTSRQNVGLTYVLPNRMAFEHDTRLVCSNSVEGERLRSALTSHGVPPGLRKMGFLDVSEFWEPWCVALHDGQVASIAFAARLCESGASLGLATAPELRGRGYAAAATAGWTQMPSLQSRALFYSTDRGNVTSQRVIARLGLRFLGSSFTLS